MYYYGQTKSGKRIHLGNLVLEGRGQQGDDVETFCGHQMESWDQGERPPTSKVEEFCKLCFRTYAWDVMIKEVEANAALAERLEAMVESAFEGNWSFGYLADQLIALSKELKPAGQPDNMVSITA